MGEAVSIDFTVVFVFVMRDPSAIYRCDKDYVDIYAEIPRVDVDIMREQLSGRYCGTVSPRIRISLHNVIVLVFHTRSDSAGTVGFSGTYQFISNSKLW